MNSTAIILVVISAFFHATRNLFTKASLDKQVFLWWYSIFGMLFFLPIFGYGLSRGRLPSTDVIPVIGISGAIHCLYWFFHTRAYEGGDLSRVYPIMRSAPAVVLLFALLFLHEKVSFAGAVGIGLVAIGIYMINMRHLSATELILPLRAATRDRPTRYALLTMLSVAAYSIVDKVAVQRTDPLVFAFLHLFVGMLLYTPYILYTRGTALIRRVWLSDRRTIMANGLLGIFGYTLILVAFTIENVSYVVGLRQLSIVFAVVMGGRLLQEEHQTVRLISALIIFAGAFLICVAG